MTGVVLQVQRFSIHDGPGIRATVFLKGCPLSCAWCHNPESQAARPEVIIVEAHCLRCGTCVEACPEHFPMGRPPLDACLRCGVCAEVCPTGARRLAGRERSVDDVLAEVLRDRYYFEDSGGGLTVSGGEPMAQPEFTIALLGAAREAGLHTALDTCGHADQAQLLRAAESADLVLFDLKLPDETLHRRWTGVDGRRIRANLAALAAAGRRIWIRIPVIPGVNDDPDILAGLADIAATHRAETVSLLPYHATGEAKFGRIGREYELGGTRPPSAATMESLADVVRARGLPVRLGA